MTKQNFPKIPSSEITSKSDYLSRRDFIKATGLLAGSLVLSACAPRLESTTTPEVSVTTPMVEKKDEIGGVTNTLYEITNYNNYYEFTTVKEGVAELSKDFITSPWDVEVYGLVNKPKTYSVEELTKEISTGRTDLSFTLCRSLEHGDPLVGVPVIKIAYRSRAYFGCKICPV